MYLPERPSRALSIDFYVFSKHHTMCPDNRCNCTEYGARSHKMDLGVDSAARITQLSLKERPEGVR